MRAANVDHSQQLMLGIDGAEPVIEPSGVRFDSAGHRILMTFGGGK
jgi:hypothetical protein